MMTNNDYKKKVQSVLCSKLGINVMMKDIILLETITGGDGNIEYINFKMAGNTEIEYVYWELYGLEIRLPTSETITI